MITPRSQATTLRATYKSIPSVERGTSTNAVPARKNIATMICRRAREIIELDVFRSVSAPITTNPAMASATAQISARSAVCHASRIVASAFAFAGRSCAHPPAKIQAELSDTVAAV